MLYPLRVELVSATPREGVVSNLRKNRPLGLPLLGIEQPRPGAVSVCGGGPSIVNTLDELTGDIWATNGTHDYLKKQGIKVDVGFFWDPSPYMANHINLPDKDTKYYLASHCHPDLINKLKGYDISLFHANLGHPVEDVINELDWDGWVFQGGTGAATRAPFIAYGQGYREIHMHGVDSSFEDMTHVDRDDSVNFPLNELEVICAGRTFRTAAWMARQAQEITKFPKGLPDAEIYVHGDGLLPHVAMVSGMHYNQRIC